MNLGRDYFPNTVDFCSLFLYGLLAPFAVDVSFFALGKPFVHTCLLKGKRSLTFQNFPRKYKKHTKSLFSWFYNTQMSLFLQKSLAVLKGIKRQNFIIKVVRTMGRFGLLNHLFETNSTAFYVYAFRKQSNISILQSVLVFFASTQRIFEMVGNLIRATL